MASGSTFASRSWPRPRRSRAIRGSSGSGTTGAVSSSRACEPNAAHHVLADWSLRFPQFTLITQNVDGLHERAGTARVLRLHGSIWDVGCWSECAASAAPLARRHDAVPRRCRRRAATVAARCGRAWCGSARRWTPKSWTRASRPPTATCSSRSGPPPWCIRPRASSITRRRSGALTVEINPDSTPASGGVDVALALPAERALPDLDRQLGPHPLALQTSRLSLRPVLPRDTAMLHQLWTDPAVRRFLWDDAVIPVTTAAAVTSASANDFAARHYGLWSLCTPAATSRTLAGFCGLRSEGIGARSRAALRPPAGLLAAGARSRGRASGGGVRLRHSRDPENHRGDRCAQRAIRAHAGGARDALRSPSRSSRARHVVLQLSTVR